MTKVSNMLIGIVVVSLFVTCLGIYYADIATTYSVTYNDTQFAGYQQLNSINDNLGSIQGNLTATKQNTGVVDLIGGFLASGFSVLKITFNSFTSLVTMSSTAFSQTTILGSMWQVFQSHLIAIAFILFIFAIIAVLVGRDI